MPRGMPTGGTVIIRAAGAYIVEPCRRRVYRSPRGQTERHKPSLVREAAPSGPVGGKDPASTAGQFFASAEGSVADNAFPRLQVRCKLTSLSGWRPTDDSKQRRRAFPVHAPRSG